MFDLQPIGWERFALIFGIYLGLYFASRGFNSYIAQYADIDPEGPNSGMYVVLGTSYTLLAATAIFAILWGLEQAVWTMLVVFSCFAVAGVPMLFGVQQRAAHRRLRERQEAERAARASAIAQHNED